jgi:hypothetical protein
MGESRPKDAVKKLISARNESDPEVRRRLLQEALSGHCEFTDGRQRTVVGRGAISALISEEMLDPAHWVRLKARVTPSGERYVFRWSISSSIAKSRSELCWLELDGEGRINRLTIYHSVEASPSLSRQVFRWVRDHPAPALAAAAGILYAVLRISMAVFYNQFDMTPEEAGFSNDEVLRQSATFLGVLLLYGLLSIVFNWLAVTPFVRINAVIERLGLMQESKNRRLLLVGGWGPFALALMVFYAVGFFGNSPTATLVSAGVAAFCFLVVPRLVLLLPLVRDVIVLADDSVRRSRHLGLSRVLSIGSAGVAALLVFLLPLLAIAAADEVKSYGDAGGRLFPWRALPATVKWTTEAPLVNLANDCHDLRLLGESGEKVFLFDRDAETTVRIPAQDVIVSTRDC